MAEKKTPLAYRIIRRTLTRLYRPVRLVGGEHLPEGACIVVGNHAQAHGPLSCELFFPAPHAVWCAGEMMHLRTVPDYAYRDFWSKKPRAVRWLFRLISYLIAPLSVLIFRNSHCIGVYHDARITSTFRETLQALERGEKVIIFPERDVPYNGILWKFQTGFADVAKLYYRRTGKELTFVPLYVAPAFHTMYLGEGVRFSADAPMAEERDRICAELARRITEIAESLPRHTVVPYPNVSKREYPVNVAREVSDHEETDG